MMTKQNKVTVTIEQKFHAIFCIDASDLIAKQFLYYITKKSLRKTNPVCLVKSNVVCDRSDPLVTFSLENGSSVLFKSKNLSALEMFELYNKHITSLLPKEEPVSVVKTKSEKAAQKKR